MTKMNKAVFYLFLLFCLCIVPASLVSAGDVIENNNSGIPDKKLYRAILKELGKKPNKKFTKQEAAKLKFLNASYKGIKNLKGIKYLKQLKQLDLEANGLKNLKGIQSLTNLTELNISRNSLKNLKQLEIA